MCCWTQGEEFGLEGASVLCGEVRRVGENAYVYRVRGKDREVVRVRRDNELSDLIGHWSFDDLGAASVCLRTPGQYFPTHPVALSRLALRILGAILRLVVDQE